MNRFIKIILIGVGLGILLVFVQKAFAIEEGVFWRYYLIAGAAAIIGAALVNLLYNGKYQKKMQAAMALRNTGATDAYIEAIEGLLKTAKGSQLRTTLQLNLSAGYCDRGQYDRAIAILEALPQKKLRGAVKVVANLNLCASYFYGGQAEKGLALYHDNQKLFAPYRKTPVYGGNLAVLEMFAMIAAGQYDEAEDLLESAQKTWDIPRLYDDYQYIEALLLRRRQPPV